MSVRLSIRPSVLQSVSVSRQIQIPDRGAAGNGGARIRINCSDLGARSGGCGATMMQTNLGPIRVDFVALFAVYIQYPEKGKERTRAKKENAPTRGRRDGRR